MSRGRRRAWRSRHRVKLGGQWVYWLLVLLAAAMLFTAAVILGNNLKRRAEAGGDLTTGDVTTLPDFDPSGVPTVIARAAEFGKAPAALGRLEAAGGAASDETEKSDTGDDTAVNYEDTSSPAVSETTADGTVMTVPPVQYTEHSYNAYSVVMLSEAGEPVYSSEVRRRLLGNDGGDASLPQPSDGMALFGDSYVSGVMLLHYREAEADMRSLRREYEIALAAEVLRAGADDVLLFGLALDADAADLCESVRAAAGRDCSVGIAIKYDDVVSEEARESLVVWGGSFDLIALDLRGAESAAEIEAKLHAVRALIGIYRMRVIVDDIPGMAAAAIDGGAENVAEMARKAPAELHN